MFRSILICLFLFTPNYSFAASLCEISIENTISKIPLAFYSQQTELVFEKSLHYKNIPFDQMLYSRRLDTMLIDSPSLSSRNSIYIGIQPNGHAYIVADTYRFDGTAAFSEHSLHKKTNLLSEGFVIRIDDTKEFLTNKFKLYFDSENKKIRSLSCIGGTCQAIEQIELFKLSPQQLKTSLRISL